MGRSRTRVALLCAAVVLVLSAGSARANFTCSGSPTVVLCAYGPPSDEQGRHDTAQLWIDSVERSLETAIVDERSKGVLIQAIRKDETVCKPQMFLPLFLSEETWSTPVRSFLYLIALLWSFLGIAIIADIFMAAIEVITSTEKSITFTDAATGQPRTISVLVWNETIANLTLMALGSSAPEILLAVIETVSQLGEPPSEDGLGVSTIVGSAAFNLLMILAICVVAIPNGERRRVKEVAVFSITSISSIVAYVWLLFVLQWSSKDEVTLVEALITLAMFPILVFVSYRADRGMCRRRSGGSSRGPPSPAKKSLGAAAGPPVATTAGQGDNVVERSLGGTGSWITGTGGMGARAYGGGSLPTTGGRSGGSAIVPVRGPDGHRHRTRARDLLHVPIRMSRATYRMNGIRMLTGGERLFVPRDRLHKLETEIKEQARRQLAERKSDTDDVDTVSSRRILASTLPPGKVMFSFTTPTYGVLEHQGRVVLTVSRLGGMGTPAAVQYETSNGSALAGQDYTATSGILHFGPDQRSATVVVPITDDDISEPDENFFCTLKPVPARLQAANAGECVMGEYPVAEVVIIDDDKPGSFQFEQGVYTVAENVGILEIPVVRQRGSDGEVVLQFSTADGTAVAGQDYVAAAGSLTFAHGEMRKVVSVRIIDDEAYEKVESFSIRLKFKDEACGAVYGKHKVATINTTNDEEFKRLVDKMALMINLNLDRLQVRTSSWAQQFKSAMSVHAGDVNAEPTGFDYVMHFLAFFWKVLFAIVPPTSFGGGWVAFCVALAFIGILTSFVSDIATVFGCTLGLPDAITAITFVALGTSLPDTFASKSAAVNDKHADASVGNVTGSNSVNVFLGLGLPWTIAAIYHQAKGTSYVVPAGALSFSVTVFCVCACLCLGLLFLRRRADVAGGELGGSARGKWATGAFFAVLWIVYIVLSSLKSLDKL